ncbi:hypothetical protein BDW02DRAFT_567013 [Decorospora gaudefroyi]|uniref:Uncharacterized protein n=1 Tax=Decorospora gaudefroyi TaxID=184978 RepID=A0A6A5KLG5_9PLEO|nr:hypothetical protein BDW02DRAFT_567013 [Decorospora gaudefroyi]
MWLPVGAKSHIHVAKGRLFVATLHKRADRLLRTSRTQRHVQQLGESRGLCIAGDQGPALTDASWETNITMNSCSLSDRPPPSSILRVFLASGSLAGAVRNFVALPVSRATANCGALINCISKVPPRFCRSRGDVCFGTEPSPHYLNNQASTPVVESGVLNCNALWNLSPDSLAPT